MSARELDFDPLGFEPLDAEWWPAIADGLTRPWPEEAVWMDLRWWRGQVRATAMAAAEGRERGARGRFRVARMPGRPALRARWGWTDHAVKEVVADHKAWEDTWTRDGEPAPEPFASGSPADRQRAASGSPATTRTKADNSAKIASGSPADRQRAASSPPRARSEETPDHRITDLGGSRARAPEAPRPASPGGPHAVAGAPPGTTTAVDPGGQPRRAYPPPPPPMPLPDTSPVEVDGRELPGDLTALLFGATAGRVLILEAVLRAGIESTRGLLSLPLDDLRHAGRGLNEPVRRALAQHLWHTWGVRLGCLAVPTPQPRAGAPPGRGVAPMADRYAAAFAKMDGGGASPPRPGALDVPFSEEPR